MICVSCSSENLERSPDHDDVIGRGSKRYVCTDCGQLQWVPPRPALVDDFDADELGIDPEEEFDA